jgi:hypothetical protein
MKYVKSVDWIYLAQDINPWLALANMVINEDIYLLGYNAMKFGRSSPGFRSNALPQSSESKTKANK